MPLTLVYFIRNVIAYTIITWNGTSVTTHDKVNDTSKHNHYDYMQRTVIRLTIII